MTSSKFPIVPRLLTVFGLVTLGLGACSGNANLGHDDGGVTTNVGGATAVGGTTGNVGGTVANVGGRVATTGGSTSCPLECFRAINCVAVCGGPVLSSGCCACGTGTFDDITCTSGSGGAGGAVANTGGTSGAVLHTGGAYAFGGASANVGGSVTLTGGAPANGGASANVGGRTAATGGSTSCLPECLRAINCVTVCGGPVLSSGCCACGAGTFDNITCTAGSGGAGGAVANTGGTSGTACGVNVCDSGQYCCNSSCSMCAPIGAGCVQMVCETGGSSGTGGNKATGGATSSGNCGTLACNPSTEYCHETTGGAVGSPNTYSCVPLPSSCGSSSSCACISGTSCSANCTQSSSGLLTTICYVPAAPGTGGASG